MMDIHPHPLLNRIYRARGVNRPEEINHSLQYLTPPQTLPNLIEAVNLISDAIISDLPIVVSGDYDCDGATGSAIGYRGLKALGARRVKTIVPDRVIDGYGLSPSLVDRMPKDTKIIITVDAGTSSNEGIAYAQSKGIAVLVTDHHLPGALLPEVPIVNPNVYQTDTPLAHLCGAAVMFYVLCAVRKYLRQSGYYQHHLPDLEQLLPLVAIGTVADMMPLNYNNRILVSAGITKIRCDAMPPGVREILKVARKDPKTFTSTDIGFSVAPIINAAGRIDTMEIGVDALCSDQPGQVGRIVKHLASINKTRKEQQALMVESAKAHIESLEVKESSVIVVYHESWHPGIVGLVASQLKQDYEVPVFAFAPAIQGSSELRGSGRSIDGVHLRDVLAEIDTLYPGMILKYGGHAMAAGLSLELDQLEPFKLALDHHFTKHPYVKVDQVENDGELTPDELSLETALLLRDAGPWGNQFPEPQFVGTFEVLELIVLKSQYSKLILKVDEENTIDALDFVNYTKYPDWFEDIEGKNITIQYHLHVNQYHKTIQPQLLIRTLDIL